MVPTQQGATSDEIKPVQGQNNPRVDDVDDLARLSRERRDQELRDEGFTPGDTSASDPDPDDSGAPTGAEPESVLESDEAGDDTTEDEMVTLIVDGVEKRVAMKDVLEAGRRSMQKESTADKRLREATNLLNEAKQLRGTPNQLPGSGPGVGAPPPETPPSFDAAELARALQYGSEEEAAAAVQKMAHMGANATQMQNVSQDKLLPFIQDTIAYNDAVKMLERPAAEGGYGDLWSDPTMRKLFIAKEQEVRAMCAQNNDPLPSYRELYSGIGDGLRTWRDGISPQPTTTTLSDKQNRKRSSDAPPVAGGRMSAPNRDASKPKSRKEVLAEMAAGRHQDF